MSRSLKEYKKVVDGLKSRKIPSKVKLEEDGTINIELGFDYPDLLSEKVFDMLDELDIKADIMAETSARGVESESIYGGPQEYEREYDDDDDDYYAKGGKITIKDIEKSWDKNYGEDFKGEYSGLYKELKNEKDLTPRKLDKLWDETYGEDFKYEYYSIYEDLGGTYTKDEQEILDEDYKYAKGGEIELTESQGKSRKIFGYKTIRGDKYLPMIIVKTKKELENQINYLKENEYEVFKIKYTDINPILGKTKNLPKYVIYTKEQKFSKGGWIDFKSKREINKIKKELEDKGDAYSIKYDTDGNRFGLKGGGRYRITTGEYLSTVYAKGGRVMSLERLATKLRRAYPNIRMREYDDSISVFEDFPTDRRGDSIADYYSESQDRVFGMANHFDNFLKRNGYWAEWVNPEHFKIYKLDNYAKGGLIDNTIHPYLLQQKVGKQVKTIKGLTEDEDRKITDEMLKKNNQQVGVNINYSISKDPNYYAKGGKIDIKLKDWYKKNYPTDELGEEMNDTNTFENLEDALNKGDDVYNTIGVGDSVIRERLFEHFAKIKGEKYEFIYQKWLGEGMITDAEIKSIYKLEKGGEVKKKGNEMIMGGLAGLLLGIFLNK